MKKILFILLPLIILGGMYTKGVAQNVTAKELDKTSEMGKLFSVTYDIAFPVKIGDSNYTPKMQLHLSDSEISDFFAITFELNSTSGLEDLIEEAPRKSKNGENFESYYFMNGDVKPEILLSNGEILSDKEMSLSFEFATSTTLFLFVPYTDFSSRMSAFHVTRNMYSNKISLNNNVERKGYIAQQLKTYDIKRITLNSPKHKVSLNLQNAHTTTAFNAMFDKLASCLNANKSRYSFIKPNRPSTSISKVVFKNITTEHNLYQNGQKGMKVVVSFDIEGYKKQKCEVNAYFFYEDGKALKDINHSYRAADGQVSAGTYITPGWDTTTYTNLEIFIPYRELHLSYGKSNLKTYVEIFTPQKKSIGKSKYTTFWWKSN